MDENYSLTSEVMMCISNKCNVFLDFIVTSDTNDVMNGTFSYDGLKNQMIYLKPIIPIQ